MCVCAWNKATKREKEKINLDAAKNAERIWNEATQANSEHPYLKRKAVKAYGLKQSQRDGFDVLIVPLKDIHKKIWSLQWIYPDQRKLDKIFMIIPYTTSKIETRIRNLIVNNR